MRVLAFRKRLSDGNPERSAFDMQINYLDAVSSVLNMMKQPDSACKNIDMHRTCYSEYTFGYIAGWSSGRDMKELKSSLDTIRVQKMSIIRYAILRFSPQMGIRKGAHLICK